MWSNLSRIKGINVVASRWRSGGRQILVEDERVDSYYQIAFPERANEEASLDSGIENPTYKYTMSELQAAEAEQLASLR